MRGRVMSLWGILNRSGPAMGALVLGGLSGYLGFQWPMLAAVGISACVAAFVVSKRHKIRDILVAAEKADDGP